MPLKPRLKRLPSSPSSSAVHCSAFGVFVFGMFIAVASDLSLADPLLRSTRTPELRFLLDARGRELASSASRTGSSSRPTRSRRTSRRPLIATRDKRFRTNSGWLTSAAIARASSRHRAQGDPAGASLHRAGSSSIERSAGTVRTAPSFEKLARASPSPTSSLTVVQGKDPHCLPQHDLLSGNGAYGVESAAQNYFGQDVNHLGCAARQATSAASTTPAWRPLCSRA